MDAQGVYSGPWGSDSGRRMSTGELVSKCHLQTLPRFSLSWGEAPLHRESQDWATQEGDTGARVGEQGQRMASQVIKEERGRH